VSEQKQGTQIHVNDGSGPVGVNAMEGLDADLKQSYSGAPPGGQGLGILANLLTGAIFHANERVLQYRATEKILPAQGNVFVMGQLKNGVIQKGDGMLGSKLVVSTRGRDGLLGATKRNSIIGFVAGGVLLPVGALIAIFGGSPKDTSCHPPFKDGLAEMCTGAMKEDKLSFEWQVSKAGWYEISFKQPSDAKVNSWPAIYVRNSDGDALNDWQDGSQDSTVKLAADKGSYKITVEAYGAWHPSELEGGYRYEFNIKFIKALADGDSVSKAKKGDDDDDKGSAKKTDDDDDKGSAAATTTASATTKPKGTTTAAPKTTTTAAPKTTASASTKKK
jgi:hypothetical protein